MTSDELTHQMLKIKNKFSEAEDRALRELVGQYGDSDWGLISSKMPNRNVRQCHDRWVYYLSPDINNEPWTEEEEMELINLINSVGLRWVKISKIHGKRNDVQLKNRWNIIKRRMNLKISHGKVVPISKPRSIAKKSKRAQRAEKEKPKKAMEPNVDETLFKDLRLYEDIIGKCEDSVQQFKQCAFLNPFDPILFELF
jgi:myb proto-oncogene protein